MATQTLTIDDVTRQAVALSAAEIDARLRQLNTEARILRALLREARSRERNAKREEVPSASS